MNQRKTEDLRMTKSNLNELLGVLEEIRSEKYPDIPKEVIEKIAETQYENQDNRELARQETIRLIAEFLSSTNVSKEEK